TNNLFVMTGPPCGVQMPKLPRRLQAWQTGFGCHPERSAFAERWIWASRAKRRGAIATHKWRVRLASFISPTLPSPPPGITIFLIHFTAEDFFFVCFVWQNFAFPRRLHGNRSFPYRHRFPRNRVH
ncbi:MAG: hypothetical protein WCA58_15630, partial [Terriglobales bacterium]